MGSMKGFKKNGKFIPTGNKSKSTLKKSDVRKKQNLGKVTQPNKTTTVYDFTKKEKNDDNGQVITRERKRNFWVDENGNKEPKYRHWDMYDGKGEYLGSNIAITKEDAKQYLGETLPLDIIIAKVEENPDEEVRQPNGEYM